MGRRIYCGEDFVWKYAFGKQSSEQYRVAEELGIGRIVNVSDYGDTLILSKEDIPALEEYLEEKEYGAIKAEYDLIHINHGSDGWIQLGSDLDKELNAFSDREPDFYFLAMIDRFIKYMKEHPERTVFEFDGEV